MIVFKNPGVIDVRSITTFGVSVKEGDNPIGFFGTGLKYAIAVLLRTGHAVSVYAGPDCFTFGVRSDSIRGKQFDFVTMAVDDGEPVQLGFTTELGKQWEVWMAYREIACNCMDEGGAIEEVASIGAAGQGTTVAVTGAAFAEAYRNRDRYILSDQPAFTIDSIEVRDRPGVDFYYRGVRVHRWAQEGLYTYNCRSTQQLTEDRTLKSDYGVRHDIALAFLSCTNARVLERVLTADKQTLEGTLDFDGWSRTPSAEFLQTVGECVSMGVTDLNPTAVKLWRKVTKKEIDPREVALTAVQLRQLNRALDFCAHIGFPVRGTYPIKIAESLGDGTLGLAYEGTIFIAERVFHQGTKQLASTLIEEYLHLRHRLEDESRELQTYLFDRVVSLGEELVGEPL